MGTEQHLNWDQHALTEQRIRALTRDDSHREMLSRVAQGSTRVAGYLLGNGHIQLRIEGDGLVHIASTPSDHRAVKNNESRIRRQMSQIGHDFPRKKHGQ